MAKGFFPTLIFFFRPRTYQPGVFGRGQAELMNVAERFGMQILRGIAAKGGTSRAAGSRPVRRIWPRPQAESVVPQTYQQPAVFGRGRRPRVCS